MAARRLIIVMLVLLGVSTAIAIIAPDPVERTTENSTTGETGTTGDAPGEGDGATGDTGPAGSTGSTGATGATGRESPGDGSGDRGANGPAGTVERSNGGRTISITATVGGRAFDVCVRPQSRLILTLSADTVLDVSIPEFGRTETATGFSPAVFDLLLPEEPGSFVVETLGGDRRLATVNSSAGCGRPGISSGVRLSGVD